MKVSAPTTSTVRDQQHDEQRRVGGQRARARPGRASWPPASRRSPAPGSRASSGRRTSPGPSVPLYQGVLAPRPANALPLLLPADENAYSTSLKPWMPGLKMVLRPEGATTESAVPTSTTQRRQQHDQRGHLHLVGLDLLAQVLGRAADHQPGHEHGDDRERQHAVEPGADAAVDHLAELHQPHRDQPAERRERVVHGVDRAVGGGGGRGRPQRGEADAEARLLALHVAAGLGRATRAWSAPSAVSARIAALLGPHRDRRGSPRGSRSSRRAPPSPGACPSPSGRTCSRAPPEMIRIASSSRKHESGVEFSNGCAELTLKKPPPLVPSCLIAICEAAGPERQGLLGDRLAVGAGGRLRPAWRCDRARTSAPRPARPAPPPARSRAAAGCRACCAPGRPRSCRSSPTSAA